MKKSYVSLILITGSDATLLLVVLTFLKMQNKKPTQTKIDPLLEIKNAVCLCAGKALFSQMSW